MAATCQERGITHVKDVFSAQAKKKAEDEKEVASNFFFGFSTGTKPTSEKSPAPGGGAGGGKSGTRPGGFLMRNGKSKDVDIMEIPVPPPRKQRADSSNGNSSKSSGGPTPQLLSSPTKPVNSKDTYLAPRSVTKSAQRNSSTSSGNSNNSERERSRSKDAVTVAMIHRPPAVTLPSPTVIPTSPTKRTAPLPPGGGPTSPPWRSSLPRSPPPPPNPEAQVPRSPPPPPPPPQFASSSPTRVVAPPPPRTSRIFSPVVQTPPDVPLPPPPPPPMTTTSPPPFRATTATTTQNDMHQDRASKSRYSSESHTLHIDTSSPLTHGHRREGSGDYSTGSLFNGEDDRDIIVSSQDNQSNHSPVFRDMLVSMDTHDPSPSTGLNNNNNKQQSPNNAALFKKQRQPDIVVDYNSKKPTSPTGFATKPVVSSGLPDNESSILTNSEHGAASSGYFSELSTTDSEKSPPSPAVLKKKNQNNKGTIEGSSSSSSFEEEVFSMNFDEDKFAETNSTKIYHEYDGEDFGKYLQEDDPYPPSTTTLTRRVQRKKQEQYGQPRTLPPPNRSSPHTPQGQKRGAGLKEKFTQAFTLTRSEKKSPRYQGAPHQQHQHQQPKTSIHEMSFMNSKMGMYASEEDMRDYMARDLETKSDLGGFRKSSVNEMPSWHKDTLSVSTLRRAKRELDQRQALSSSTPNLTDHGYFVGGGSPQNGSSTSPPTSPRYGESYSDFGADIKKKKKVNRFKFWKVFGKKKKGGPSGPVIENQQPECVDVRL